MLFDQDTIKQIQAIAFDAYKTTGRVAACWTAAEMEIDLWPRRCPPPLSGWNVVRWHFAGSASNARRFHRKPQRMRLPRPRWTWPAGWNAAIMDGSISASIPSAPLPLRRTHLAVGYRGPGAGSL